MVPVNSHCLHKFYAQLVGLMCHRVLDGAAPAGINENGIFRQLHSMLWQVM